MMDFLSSCGNCCFKCSLTSNTGTLNTYEIEQKQAKVAVADRNRLQNDPKKTDSGTSSISSATACTLNKDISHESTLIGDKQFLQGTTVAQDSNTLVNDCNTGNREKSQKIKSNISSNKQMSSPSSAPTSSSASATDATKTGSSKSRSSNKDDNGPVLSKFNLDGIAELFAENRIGKSSVIVLVGAGMSTAAGVPDFRSPNTGIYANLQKYNLPHPEDVFKISYFKNNPAPFYDLSRSILPDKLYPTLSHYFVRLLHEKGYLLRCFSQNVDCLESLSGIPKDKLCLAHGSFETGHCLRCNAEYSLAWMRKIVEEGGIPHCTTTQDCRGLIKPDVKLFGERLDGRFFRLAKEDFPNCQLLIIIGSSLTVMPFAQLVQRVPPRCPRLLINKTRSGHDIPLILRLFKSGDGLMYDKKGNTRDVAFIGDCDEACRELSIKLNWHNELIELARRRRLELEQEQSDQIPQ